MNKFYDGVKIYKLKMSRMKNRFMALRTRLISLDNSSKHSLTFNLDLRLTFSLDLRILFYLLAFLVRKNHNKLSAWSTLF